MGLDEHVAEVAEGRAVGDAARAKPDLRSRRGRVPKQSGMVDRARDGSPAGCLRPSSLAWRGRRDHREIEPPDRRSPRSRHAPLHAGRFPVRRRGDAKVDGFQGAARTLRALPTNWLARGPKKAAKRSRSSRAQKRLGPVGRGSPPSPAAPGLERVEIRRDKAEGRLGGLHRPSRASSRYQKRIAPVHGIDAVLPGDGEGERVRCSAGSRTMASAPAAVCARAGPSSRASRIRACRRWPRRRSGAAVSRIGVTIMASTPLRSCNHCRARVRASGPQTGACLGLCGVSSRSTRSSSSSSLARSRPAHLPRKRAAVSSAFAWRRPPVPRHARMREAQALGAADAARLAEGWLSAALKISSAGSRRMSPVRDSIEASAAYPAPVVGDAIERRR